MTFFTINSVQERELHNTIHVVPACYAYEYTTASAGRHRQVVLNESLFIRHKAILQHKGILNTPAYVHRIFNDLPVVYYL